MLARRLAASTIASRALSASPAGPAASRSLCVNLRKSEGDAVDSYFAKKQREQLEKLKANLAAKKRPIDEADVRSVSSNPRSHTRRVAR